VPNRLAVAPNVEPRPPGVWPSILLFHYTGMASAAVAEHWLCAPQSRVSCHYLVDEEGAIVQMAGEEMRAWHAGHSSWSGETDINSHSVGIEIHNPGHGLGYPDFPLAQMKAVIALSQDIIARHSIRPERVLAHSDVAPRRKIDPGEKFDWALCHREGVGHWVMPAVLADAQAFSTHADEIARFQQQLHDYGYEISASGAFDKQTETVVKAFQRHFRPARVDGIADRSTVETLESLRSSLQR
jgi:N-acetylmuramoyl-L-alanine amidase